MLILLVFSSCTAKAPVIIGYSGGLTGVGSELGRSGMYGVQLAVEDANAEGGILGRKIKLEIQNDFQTAEGATEADQALYDKGCRIIIGHMISGVYETTVAFANEKKILMISPTIATDALTGIDDNFFRLIPTNLTQAQLISDQISYLNIQHLTIIHSSSNPVFTQEIISYIEKDLLGHGLVKISRILYDPSNGLDYTSITKKLVELGTDAIVNLTPADETAHFAQNFALNGLKTKVFLPAWSMTSDLIQGAGKSAEGFFGVNYIDLALKDEDYLSFQSRYLQKFGSKPSFSSVLAYEATMVAIQAMRSSKSTDAMRIKQEILRIRRFNGISGVFEFDQFGDVQRKISLFQVKDGTFIKVNP